MLTTFLPEIPLPSLPTTAFKSVVRAEFVNNNVTVEATEYVDESVNAATVVVTQNGQTSRVIMSYQTNEVFYVVPDRSSDTITPGMILFVCVRACVRACVRVCVCVCV